MEVTFGRQFIFKFFNICIKKILKIEMSYKIFSNSRLKINDHFDKVFIKTFLKFFLKKKKKISKTIYLFYLLICFFNKNESNSP